MVLLTVVWSEGRMLSLNTSRNFWNLVAAYCLIAIKKCYLLKIVQTTTNQPGCAFPGLAGTSMAKLIIHMQEAEVVIIVRSWYIEHSESAAWFCLTAQVWRINDSLIRQILILSRIWNPAGKIHHTTNRECRGCFKSFSTQSSLRSQREFHNDFENFARIASFAWT